MFFVGFFFGVLLISIVLISWQAIYPDGSSDNQMPIGQVFSTRKNTHKKKPKFVSEEEQWKKEQTAPPADPGE